jgi:hypothetical protein
VLPNDSGKYFFSNSVAHDARGCQLQYRDLLFIKQCTRATFKISAILKQSQPELNRSKTRTCTYSQNCIYPLRQDLRLWRKSSSAQNPQRAGKARDYERHTAPDPFVYNFRSEPLDEGRSLL